MCIRSSWGVTVLLDQRICPNTQLLVLTSVGLTLARRPAIDNGRQNNSRTHEGVAKLSAGRSTSAKFGEVMSNRFRSVTWGKCYALINYPISCSASACLSTPLSASPHTGSMYVVFRTDSPLLSATANSASSSQSTQCFSSTNQPMWRILWVYLIGE